MLGLPSFALSSCLCATLALSQATDPNQLQLNPPASRTLESLSAGWAASGEALSAVASLEAAQRHRDLLRRLDLAEGVLRVRLQRCQLRFASHHWLHEEALPNPGGQTLPAR